MYLAQPAADNDFKFQLNHIDICVDSINITTPNNLRAVSYYQVFYILTLAQKCALLCIYIP